MTQLTCHSEYGKIQSLFVKKAADAFHSSGYIDQQWQELNYVGKPSFSGSVSEYAAFEAILNSYAEQISCFPINTSVTMDSIYCRDASISTNKGMIICNMGKALRNNEPKAVATAFEINNIQILGEIRSPGTVEGGDVAWLDERTLAVGHSYRTNEAGIDQLRQILEPIGVQLVVVALPHYKGPGDVFHLMSILSPVDKDLAVVYSPLMPIAFRNELLRRNYQLVEVPQEEFESMGCNVLALAPRVCLMVAGNPITKSRLEKAGCYVIEYKGEEISVKGGGGPTCLTRPITRYAD
jgi:N-dimethylarginine dimethylaminohydrolase